MNNIMCMIKIRILCNHIISDNVIGCLRHKCLSQKKINIKNQYEIITLCCGKV